VHEELTGAGYSRISLWVLFENTRAIAFYRKHGFVFDGRERTAAVRGATLREVRMVWAPA
jgi:RimJ/RimL family protein N-acetyltransferase